MLLENKIRPLRVEQGILQRQVAAYLEIDTPMFSKIERGDRRAKRSQVIQMATYFYIFRSIPVQSVVDLQYRGKVNTFFLNSLPLAQLFLIHARFRHDRPPQYLTCPHIIPVLDAIGQFPWPLALKRFYSSPGLTITFSYPFHHYNTL